MTNAQIIFENRVFLMQEGVLRATEETVTIQNEDGTEEKIPMPEEIHTYNGWKKLGYQVQKGEHAVAKFPIWKYKSAKKQDDEAGDEEQPQKGKMFKKVAFFFTIDQVKKVD